MHKKHPFSVPFKITPANSAKKVHSLFLSISEVWQELEFHNTEDIISTGVT